MKNWQDKLDKETRELYKKLVSKCAENGMSIRVNGASKMDECGEFCIFLYDKNVQKRYLVGYDGVWYSKQYNFYKCLEEVLHYLDTYLETGKDLKKTISNLFPPLSKVTKSSAPQMAFDEMVEHSRKLN